MDRPVRGPGNLRDQIDGQQIWKGGVEPPIAPCSPSIAPCFSFECGMTRLAKSEISLFMLIRSYIDQTNAKISRSVSFACGVLPDVCAIVHARFGLDELGKISKKDGILFHICS